MSRQFGIHGYKFKYICFVRYFSDQYLEYKKPSPDSVYVSHAEQRNIHRLTNSTQNLYKQVKPY